LPSIVLSENAGGEITRGLSGMTRDVRANLL
jgi:hypothetical protein